MSAVPSPAPTPDTATQSTPATANSKKTSTSIITSKNTLPATTSGTAMVVANHNPYDTIIAEQIGAVGIIRLNRPAALNALSTALLAEFNTALDIYINDTSVRAIMITGNEKAFAAGGDIKDMMNKTYVDAYQSDFITAAWEKINDCRKPVIAAVNGFALGGGCELAMMCDIIIAGQGAKFGQPEITLGVIPGAGATQRLTRAIGKAKTMDMILTGRMMTAAEAERAGLVSRVVPNDDLEAEAIKLANRIASFSAPITAMAKEAVKIADETSLSEGIRAERRLFYSCFATNDQKEGMAAFAQKRAPKFTDS